MRTVARGVWTKRALRRLATASLLVIRNRGRVCESLGCRACPPRRGPERLSGVTESAVHGHWELEPTENGNAHVDGVGFDFERGVANLRVTLEETDVDYELTTVETGSDH